MDIKFFTLFVFIFLSPYSYSTPIDYSCDEGKQLLDEGNIDEAILFWRKGVDSTSVYYQSRQVFGCLADTGVLTNSNQIYSILESFAKKGSSQAELMLGIRHYQSSAIKPSALKDASHWITRAMEHGNIDAKAIYAAILTDDRYLEKDIGHAMKLYTEAANEGSIIAQQSLVKTYKKGRFGIDKDLEKADYWSKRIDETTRQLHWTSKEKYKEYRSNLEKVEQF